MILPGYCINNIMYVVIYLALIILENTNIFNNMAFAYN